MKVLIIGHISIDYRNGEELWGGPPLYQIPVLQSLNCQIHVITSANQETHIFQDLDIRVDIVPSSETTTYQFEISEDEGERKLFLVKRADSLNFNKIQDYLDPHYDIILISPIAGELDHYTMEQLVKFGKFSFLDAQGIVRFFRENGEVYHELTQTELDWAMKTFDYIKFSTSEISETIKILDNKSTLIITKSGKGYDVIKSNDKLQLNMIPEKDIIDDTGSGDIFLAAFSYFSQKFSILDSIKKADVFSRKALIIKGIPKNSDFSNLFDFETT
ncbi:MAG: PfkB family carbohydrate kinase [Candidatus Heimdallarchaeota archaeon]|nr:PfkB family carbohydrate kinase [Candidatus Heimdallarchaeota archaeon]MDH5645562.1 PfkB family carbohydrate kinase [Candidatus Heimdallarchaeota archaeon]